VKAGEERKGQHGAEKRNHSFRYFRGQNFHLPPTFALRFSGLRDLDVVYREKNVGLTKRTVSLAVNNCSADGWFRQPAVIAYILTFSLS